MTKRWIAALLALTCAACAGGAGKTLPRTPAAAPLLFVLAGRPPYFEIREYRSAGGAPVRTIPAIDGPLRLAIDPLGTIYVVHTNGLGAFGVNEYDAGATSISRTLAGGIGPPAVVATDARGSFYYLNAKKPLVAYAHAATTPSYAASNGLCSDTTLPPDLTADGAGNAYVLDQCGRRGQASTAFIREYDSSGVLQRSIALPGFQDGELPSFVTADASGRLYLEFFAFSKATASLGIAVYEPGASTPSRTFLYGPHTSGRLQIVGGYTPVVNDATGELITNFSVCQRTGCRSDVYVFDSGASTPKATLAFPGDALIGPPHPAADGTLYLEVISAASRLESMLAYAHGSTRGKTLLQGRHIGGLLFVWPNASTAKPNGGIAPASVTLNLSEGRPRVNAIAY